MMNMLVMVNRHMMHYLMCIHCCCRSGFRSQSTCYMQIRCHNNLTTKNIQQQPNSNRMNYRIIQQSKVVMQD